MKQLDFNDTFLSYEHVQESFPGYQVVPMLGVNTEELEPPFK